MAISSSSFWRASLSDKIKPRALNQNNPSSYRVITKPNTAILNFEKTSHQLLQDNHLKPICYAPNTYSLSWDLPHFTVPVVVDSLVQADDREAVAVLLVRTRAARELRHS